jgi:AAA domain
MTLTKISGLNIKGRSFSHQLGPITIVSGPNASGKSAILATLRLCLLGYEPTLGRKKPDIFQLASAATMTGAVEFSDGKTNSFDLKANAKGVVSGSFKLDREIPAILLDSKEYFDVPKAERTAFLLKRVGASAVTVASICDQLVVGGSPAELVAQLNIHLTDLAKADKLQSFELLDCASEWLREKKLNLQRELDALQGAVDTSVRQEADQKVVHNVQSVIEQKEAELRQCNAKIEELRAELAEIDTTGRQLVDLQTKIAAFVPVPTPAMEFREAELVSAISTSDQLIANLRPVEKKTNEMAASIKVEVEKFKGLEATLVQQVAEAEGQKAAIPTITCEHCGETVQALRRLVDDQYAAMEQATKNQIAATRQGIDGMNSQLAKYRVELAPLALAERDRTKFQNELTAVRKQLADARQHNAQQATWVQLETELSFKWQQLRPRALNLDDGRATDQQRMEIEKELLALRQQHDQWTAQKADERRAEEAAAGRRKKQEEIEALKAAADAVKTYQQSIIAKAIAPLMNSASMLTRPVMGFSLEYREGDIGYISGKNWISYRTFSGTEELLFLCGLSVAFAQESPLKIVVMDELGRLSDATKHKLMIVVYQLIQKETIGQFIGVDVTPHPYKGLMGSNDLHLIIVAPHDSQP